jgi:hypothetical protein
LPDLDAFRRQMEHRLEEPILLYWAWLALQDPAYRPPTFALLQQQELDQLRRRMVAELRMAHQLAAVLGNHGGPLDQAQWDTVMNQIAVQEQYLNQFVTDLPAMSKDAALRRARLYATDTLHTVSIIASGQLPQLPHYPGDMDLACHGFCRCFLEINKLDDNDNWDVWWHLDPAGREHCVDCLFLAKSWNPLQIRGGVVLAENREVA